MAGSGSPQPKQPKAPKPSADLKPPQVMQITRKDEQERLRREADEARAAAEQALQRARELEQAAQQAGAPAAASTNGPQSPRRGQGTCSRDDDLFDTSDLEGLTMADLLGPADRKPNSKGSSTGSPAGGQGSSAQPAARSRSVDDFDFDEEAFLAALDENEPVGTTGDVVHGTVIGLESDGVYVDIGGKAPGFMPKSECGLGVITNLKERFPKGLEIDVLVTREQNADGMVTISCRALALRQSWDKVKVLEKEGKVVQVR